MDILPGPLPPHEFDRDPAEEEAAFYRDCLKRVTAIAIDLVDDLAANPELSLPEKAEALERLGEGVTRNALLARELRAPLPRPAHPVRKRRRL